MHFSTLMKACIVPISFIFFQDANAQSVKINVEKISSAKECSFYTYAWGTKILEICNQQFPELKERIKSSLIESFAASESFSGSNLHLNLSITGRVGELSLKNNTSSSSSFCVSNSYAVGSLDWSLVDKVTNRIISGTTTKKAEISRNSTTGSDDCQAQTEFDRPYDAIQTELARAVARNIVLKFQPLKVIGSEGNKIQLNYGRPVTEIGQLIKIGGDSHYPSTYKIVSTTKYTSWAAPYGTVSSVSINEIAEIIEGDSNEANGRRFEKVDLP